MTTVGNQPDVRSGPPKRGIDVPRVKSQLAPATLLRRYLLAILLIALLILFSIWEPSTFGTLDNFKTIAAQNSVLGIVAIGALLPLIIGQFDLSVGANLGIASILVTGLIVKSGFGAPEAIAAALIASSLVGLVNGVLVAYAGIDAFVATLGMSSLLAGAAVWYTNGQEIASGLPAGLTNLGQTHLAGIPTPVAFLVIVVLLAGYIVHATPLGRYMYALGGSKEASRLSGLNTDRLTILAFVGAGLLSGIAGVLHAAELGAGDPLGGPPFLLPAFAAVFLGATSFRSGTFNVTGTVFAVFTIAVGINGLEAVGAPSFIEQVFTGAALLFAALGSRWLSRHRLSSPSTKA